METQEKDNAQVRPLSTAEIIKIENALEVLQEYAYRINEAKGWHSPEPTDAECIANVHGEVSEINDWLRLGADTLSDHISGFTGVEEEGADVVIRLMNWFRRRKWRLSHAIIAKLEYNASRPFRHGNKNF